jgi:hypothetical protein
VKTSSILPEGAVKITEEKTETTKITEEINETIVEMQGARYVIIPESDYKEIKSTVKVQGWLVGASVALAMVLMIKGCNDSPHDPLVMSELTQLETNIRQAQRDIETIQSSTKEKSEDLDKQVQIIKIQKENIENQNRLQQMIREGAPKPKPWWKRW